MIIFYLLFGILLGFTWFGGDAISLLQKIELTVQLVGQAWVVYLIAETNLLKKGYNKNGKKLSGFEYLVFALGYLFIPVILAKFVFIVLSLIL